MSYDKSKLNTNLDHVPEHIQDEIAFSVQWLIDKSPVDIAMIWLFGSYARGDFINDRRVDKNGMISEYHSDVDILVIIHGENTKASQRKLPALLAQLQDRGELSAPFHLIHESAVRFNSALQQGEYFYQDVVKEGVLLFDDNFEIAKPQKLTYPQRRALSIRYFERFFEKASQFHHLFEYNYQRDQRTEAIYNLHQMTEHLFATYLAAMTLYKPRTHRLFDLRIEVKKLDRHIKNIFPSKKEEDRKDFAFLCDAYIDARYKEDYFVKSEVLDKLVGWVEHFQHWVYTECLKTIDDFVLEENYSAGYTLYYPLMDFESLKVRPLVEDVLVETEAALSNAKKALGHTETKLAKSLARESLLLQRLKDAGLE